MRAALLARFVLEYRLTARDPLALSSDAWDGKPPTLSFQEPAFLTRVATLLDS
jgi:hypothetical protein